MHVQKTQDDIRKVTFAKVTGAKTPAPVFFEELQDITLGGAVRYQGESGQTNQLRLLTAIKRAPGATKKELITATGIPEGSFSKAIKSALETGLICQNATGFYPVCRDNEDEPA